VADLLTDRIVMDIETDGFDGLSHPSNVVVVSEDPYAGLNRGQRRAAMSKERRAFRKRG
jgi:hypothetical protein